LESVRAKNWSEAISGPSLLVWARERKGLLLVALGFALFCLVYIDLVFYRVHALRLGSDSGTYLQTLVNFAHSGSTFNYGEYSPKLSRHDSWTYVVGLAPLIALSPRVQTLLVVGVVLLASAAFPLYFFGRSWGLSDGDAAMLSGAYLLSPSAQGWAFGNFTELHLAPVIAFGLATAVARLSLPWVLVCSLLLTGVKEDLSLFVAVFGAAIALWYNRRIGVAMAVVGIANWVAYALIERYFGFTTHTPVYHLSDPSFVQHLAFLAEVLAPFAFLPLFLGWRILLGVPLIAEITLNSTWKGELARGGGHYTIPLVVAIAIGSVIAAKGRPQIVRLVVPCALVMTLFFNTTVFRIGRHEFPPDWPGYCAASRAAVDGQFHAYALDQEADFAIAAANPEVHLLRRGQQSDRPAWSAQKFPAADFTHEPDGCESPNGQPDGAQRP
jgi:uncharacterized membrane protein